MRAIYYHSVLPGPLPGNFSAANAIGADQLQAQAAELARNWRVLSLEEVLEHLAQGQSLPERTVHVSFDDGFRNNLLAAEILDAHRLPWTLFVVSDAVLDRYTPWYVRLADALGSASRRVRFDGDLYDLAASSEKFRLKERVKAQVMRAPARTHREVLEEALAQAGLAEPVETAWPFLSADELCDLDRRGVEIGNHSASHPNLVLCSDDELDREVNQSRARLAGVLGHPVRFFSYPDGRFDRRVLTATGATHDAAMATWTSHDPLSPLRIRRFPVGPTVDDLRMVLSPGYPLRYRRMRMKWALRRHARRAWRGASRRPTAAVSSR